MSATAKQVAETSHNFEGFARHILDSVGKKKLTELRQDFHTRLRITLSQPEDDELIEDLWDFFYDWCFFEQNIPENLKMTDDQREMWNHFKAGNTHGLFIVQKASNDLVKLKDFFSGKSYPVFGGDLTVGMNKNDIVEGRLIAEDPTSKRTKYHLIRRPTFHVEMVQTYLKKKVKEFKKAKDFSTYQNWLWLLVGMYMKHRIYKQIPVEKIYDDNSRI